MISNSADPSDAPDDQSNPITQTLSSTTTLRLQPSKPSYASLKSSCEDLQSKLLVSFGPYELDEIEAVAQKVLDQTTELKLQLLKQFEKCYETVKNGFLDELERVSESVREMINRGSKWAVYEKMIFEFFDKKSDFEVDDTPANQYTLRHYLETLLSLESFLFFEELVDAHSLGAILTEFKGVFQKSAGNYSDAQKLKKLRSTIKAHSVGEQDFKTSLELGQFQLNLTDQRIQFESLWDAHPEIRKIKHRFTIKLPHLRTKQFYLLNPDSVSATLHRFLGDPEMSRKYRQVTPMARQSHLFVCCRARESSPESASLFAVPQSERESQPQTREEKAEPKPSAIFDLVNIFYRKQPLLTFRVGGHDGRCVVSASDSFLAFFIEAIGNWVVFEVQPEYSSIQVIPRDAFQQKAVVDLVFVDWPQAEKLVFIDDKRFVVVFDLLSKRVDFEVKQARVKSLHYLDRISVLLVRQNLQMGIFSLVDHTVTNWVAPGVNLRQLADVTVTPSTDSQIVCASWYIFAGVGAICGVIRFNSCR